MYKIPVGSAHGFAAVAMLATACSMLSSSAFAQEKVAVWKYNSEGLNYSLWEIPSNWDVGEVPGRYVVTESDEQYRSSFVRHNVIFLKQNIC